MFLFGLYRFCREHTSLAAPLVVMLLVPLWSYSTSEFAHIAFPAAFTRYQAATTPFYLFLLVYGFAASRRAMPKASGALLLTCLGLIGAIAYLGPLRSGPPLNPLGLFYSRLHYTQAQREPAHPELVHPIYRDEQGVGDGPIVEWLPTHNLELIAIHQSHHGRPIVRWHPAAPDRMTGSEYERSIWSWERLKLKTLTTDHGVLVRGLPSGSLVVLHRDHRRELGWLRSGEVPPEVVDEHSAATDVALARALTICEERFGKPIHQDDWLIAFRVP
jgi:hypothetical protein